MRKAEASSCQALALKPGLALAHFGLGIVLYIKGNEDLTKKHSEKRMTLNHSQKITS